jgi:hypothetical protein
MFWKNNEGPEKSPVEIPKDLACQRQKTEGDQDRASDQSASVGTIRLHFILLLKMNSSIS